MDNIDFLHINEVGNTELTKEITEEEVKGVVWECNESKSLGPDGFNFNFIK